MADRPRKPRSALDALLSRPTAADPRVRAAVAEFVRVAASELGGWRGLSVIQRFTLLACKLSLTLILVSEETLMAVESMEDPRAVAACKTIETHSSLLRKHSRDLGLLTKQRPRREQGAMLLSDIVKEYGSRNRS